MKVKCPYCTSSLEVDPSFAGELKKCQFCGGAFRIPVMDAVVITDEKNVPEKESHSSVSATSETVLWSGHTAFSYYGCTVVSIPIFLIIGFWAPLLIVAGLLLLLLLIMIRNSHSYKVTTERIVARDGIFNCRHAEVRIRNIRYVSLNHEFGMPYADLLIGTAGTGDVEIVFHKIADYEKVKEIITDQIRILEAHEP